MPNTIQKGSEKLERCGFCGCYFIGDKLLSVDEMVIFTKVQRDNAPLGYCPNAEYEDPDYEQERTVTRDMAIDAGMPEIEGQRL